MILERKVSSKFLWGARKEGINGKPYFYWLKESEVRVEGCKKIWKEKGTSKSSHHMGGTLKSLHKFLTPKSYMCRKGIQAAESHRQEKAAESHRQETNLKLSRDFEHRFPGAGRRRMQFTMHTASSVNFLLSYQAIPELFMSQEE